MFYVSAGTDTYGRVKNVSGNPIVTKFAMFQFLPIYPLQSFYFVGAGRTESTGIPLLASTQSTEIRGVPLARVDKVSVLMACARAFFAILALLGVPILFSAIMYLTGERLDEFAMMIARGLLTSLAVGIVGGLLTYAIPLTSRRERDIRRYCAELLGVSADPARVPADLSKYLVDHANAVRENLKNSRVEIIYQLVSVRADLARVIGAGGFEAKTDELLERLRQADQPFA